MHAQISPTRSSRAVSGAEGQCVVLSRVKGIEESTILHSPALPSIELVRVCEYTRAVGVFVLA